MKIILLSLYAASLLMGASGDSQSVLKEVSELRQKYDECQAKQAEIKGIDPKVLAESRDKNQKLAIEINRKNGVIKSLEQTMLLRDRSYRETNARNKNLIAQLHTQNVTQQEREMLKKALVSAKGELAVAQKELKGGSSSIVRMREELKAAKAALAKLQSQPSKVQTSEKIVTKVVEPTEQLQALRAQLNAANTVIAQLRNTPQKVQVQQPKIVYKDRIITQEKVVYKDRIVTKEKVVYKDRPVEKTVTKTVEPTGKIEALTHELVSAKATIADLQKKTPKVIYKDRIVSHDVVVYKDRPVEKVVEKVVYKDRPVEKEKVVYKDRPVEKVVEKVVYKDRPVERVIEKIVYKDRPVEKIVTKTVIQEKPIIDENTRRQMDKLALELERQKSLNAKLTQDLAKASSKRIVSAPVTMTPPPKPLAKKMTAMAVKHEAPVVQNTPTSSKKPSGVYRMASDAPIYNGPNGRAIDTWEARRSFTGSSASNGWIHITGYFVNRVFQAAGEGENLWVKESDAIQR